MTTMGPNTYMNLTELSRWFYPPHGTTPRLGQTRTIEGTPTIALTDQGGRTRCSTSRWTRPTDRCSSRRPTTSWASTFSDWDAPAPSLPSAPAPADVYDPSQG